MIKIIEYPTNATAQNVFVLYADTKTEVPNTGEATAEAAGIRKIAAGTVLYTAQWDVAVLKSDDSWAWGN